MDRQAEKAIDNSKIFWKGLITSRIELALERISKSEKYVKLCNHQKANEEIVDSLLGKLDKEDRIAIRRYYEEDTVRKGYELDEVYMQGLKDGIRCLVWLDIFQVKEWMQD